MSDEGEPKTFADSVDSIFPRRTPEEEIMALREGIRRLEDRLNVKIREERNDRWALARRVSRQEALNNLVIQVGVLALSISGGVALRQAWGEGDFWTIVTVISCATILWIAYREAERTGRRYPDPKPNED